MTIVVGYSPTHPAGPPWWPPLALPGEKVGAELCIGIRRARRSAKMLMGSNADRILMDGPIPSSPREGNRP